MENKNYYRSFKIAVLVFVAAMLAVPISLPAATLTVCPSGCNKTGIQAALNVAADGDTINVYANTAGYIEPLTVTKKVKLIGKKSNGTADAWTVGTAGNSSGPVLKYLAGYPEMISFQNDNIELKGFEIDVQGGALAGGTLMGSTLMGTTMSYLNIQYCTVKMDASTQRLVLLIRKHSVQNTTISYCSFIGPTAAADSAWFAVADSPSLADVGGSVNGITLTYNTICRQPLICSSTGISQMSPMPTIPSAIQTATSSLSKPGGTGHLQGINVNFNTFNNSTKPFADEYAVLVADTVIEADANGDWGENLAIHFNNILQDDAAGPYPIVGFQNSSLSAAGTSEITATHNWWNSTLGPRFFSAGDLNTDTRPDVSQKVGFDRISALRQSPAVLLPLQLPGPAVTATDTSINVKLEVKTKADALAAAKVFAAKYSASPVSTAITESAAGQQCLL